MTRQTHWAAAALVIAASLVLLPACGKKPPAVEDGAPAPSLPAPSLPAPTAVASEHALFVRFDAKAIREGELVAEVMKAFARIEGPEVEDLLRRETLAGFGVNVFDLDSVTICVPEWTERGPRRIAILTTNRPIDKAMVMRMFGGVQVGEVRVKPASADGMDFDLPNDRTLVWFDGDLGQKYFDGYGQDGVGWPLTASLTAAASGHTLYAQVRPDKLPESFRKREFKEYTPLMEARSATITGKLRGKTLAVSGRAAFADATAAGKGKDKIQEVVEQASKSLGDLAGGMTGGELGSVRPAVQEAERALKRVKVEAVGSEVTFEGSYSADYDFGMAVYERSRLVSESTARTVAQNNLKIVGLTLNHYNDAQGQAMIHGVGARSAPRENTTNKPLLSWRVAVLPSLLDGNVYDQFKLNEPWDSEHNKKLIPFMPKVFAPVGRPGKLGYTHLQMVIGPKAMQPGKGKLADLIPDGPASTIAVVEAAEPVIWTKPDDVMFLENDLPKEWRKKFGGLFRDGFHALMWDGSVRFVKESVSDETLLRALNPRDGKKLGSDW